MRTNAQRPLTVLEKRYRKRCFLTRTLLKNGQRSFSLPLSDPPPNQRLTPPCGERVENARQHTSAHLGRKGGRGHIQADVGTFTAYMAPDARARADVGTFLEDVGTFLQVGPKSQSWEHFTAISRRRVDGGTFSPKPPATQTPGGGGEAARGASSPAAARAGGGEEDGG